MKRHALNRYISFAALAILTLPLGAYAQGSNAGDQAKTPPAAPAPDISGVWSARGLSASIFAAGDSRMTPWAKTQYDMAKPSFGPKSVLLTETNDPVYKCLPPGVPRIYFHPFPVQIVQIPGQVVLMFEYDHTTRHVFTDGRAHPDDAEPTWMGHSIGHWEGETLVIDTVGFKEKTWIDRLGHAHSDQLHTVERLHRTAADNMQIDVTIDDPKAYTGPFTVNFNMRLQPKWDIAEMYCLDTLNFEQFEAGGRPPKQ
jgi:hypothetical protein